VWEPVALPGQYAQGYYLDVFFLPSNPQYGWACGYNGYVVRTTDGGNSWQGSVVPYNGRAGGHLESVHFVDQLNGYASGPCGAFRSTDGGATWTDVTPNFPSEGPWGCYFLSATTGVVLGGGCVGAQNFFRTTNGGQSWSLFQGNQPSSGLTDALLYPDGTGLAVSSGLLWATTDGGASWSVVTSTGPAYWNEEITRVGSTILIPWAGSNCSGQGTGGGARISTDGGQSWRTFSTGIPMFGAYLLDSQRGWICGFARQVWYTSDGGLNWQYRGCGTTGDLDDIWMTSDTTGFVVGQGIYRYARAQYRASKTTLDFGTHCPPVVRYDTLYVRNRSWNGATVTFSLGGADATAFSIVQPAAATAGIAPCDSVMVVVRYQPTRDGVHQATLTVSSPTMQQPLSVTLRGEQVGRSILLRDTLADVRDVPAGEAVYLSLGIDNQSAQTGQVTSVTRISGTPFTVQSALPLVIPPGGTSLQFSFVPPDTGWYSTRVRIRMEPCSRDTTATLRVYARSPIIGAKAPLVHSPCGEAMLDSVLVVNTGNSDLVLAALWIEPLGAPVVITGSSKGVLPITVPPGDSVWIRITTQAQSSGTATLVIDHNDRTLARNVARPLRVPITYQASPPQWRINSSQLDFGTLCVGESRTLFVELANTGPVDIAARSTAAPPFTLVTGELITLAPAARRQIGVSFTPTASGSWLEPLIIEIEPCRARDTIWLRGTAETTALGSVPAEIRVRVLAGQQQSVPVVLRSEGHAPARVVRLRLEPPDPQWQVRSRHLPMLLVPGTGDTVWLDIAAGQTPMQLRGQLCADVDSLCPIVECIPVVCTIDPPEFHALELDTSQRAFGMQRCVPTQVHRRITVTNSGTFTETLTRAWIEPANGPFTLQSPSLPVTVEPGQTIDIVVVYLPTIEGIHTATLMLESPNVWENPVQIPLSGSFARVQTSIDPAEHDFGMMDLCAEPLEVHWMFRSSGLLGDTLQLVEYPQSAAWIVPPPTRLVMTGSNDSVRVTATFNPALAWIGVSQTDRFVWESNVCPAQIIATVRTTVTRPRLDYAPTVLSLGTVMQYSTVTATIEVWNRSPLERRVLSYRSTASGVELVVRTPLPLVLAPGERQRLTVDITPQALGPQRWFLELVEGPGCIDTTLIPIELSVEPEHYWGRLRVISQTGLVGDTLRVPVVLSTRDSSTDALWRTEPAAIGFALEYDPFIVEPLGAEVGPQLLELPLEVEHGVLRVRVPRQPSRRLGASDTLVVLRLLGLQSPPLRTELHFSRSWVETSKPYTLEHDDGMVVLGACVAWMKVVAIGNVRLSVAPNPVDERAAALLVAESTERQMVSAALYTSQGQLLHRWSFEVQGYREEQLPPFSASGIYYLRVDTEHGQRVTVPIVVVR
jgi:photosystem II stability/assembly factor-like uncharacterized protein